MPVKAHTRAEMIGSGNSSGSRSTCGMNRYSRMGACTRFCPDEPVQASSGGTGPLRTAVFNMMAGGVYGSTPARSSMT